MSDPGTVDRTGNPWESAPAPRKAPNSAPRLVGAPLPMGGNAGGNLDQAACSPEEDGLRPRREVPPPGRALTNSAADQPSGVDRAMGVLRLALPFVQKLLPVLDGNFGTAVTNILTSHRPPTPAPSVNLEPVETGLSKLETQQRDLRTQFVEQNASLKRVEDQLEMLREATDRNTLEQQELLEDLKSVGSKINLFVALAIILLAGSILLNVVLYLHIKRVLP